MECLINSDIHYSKNKSPSGLLHGFSYLKLKGTKTLKRFYTFFVLIFATVLLTYNPPVSAEVTDSQIYWISSFSGIQRSSLDGSNVETPISRQDDAGSIAIDMAAGKIYWAGGTIQRSSLDGSNVETLVTGVRRPSIALDTAAGKIYWGGGYGKIIRADLDGTNIETIITNPDYAAETNANLNYRIWGIALDVTGGKIYWAESGNARDDGKIKCANLNGSDIKTIVSGLGSLRAIALDVEGDKMYWAEAGDSIKRANLNGTDIETIVSDDFMTGIALDVTDGKIYWANDLPSDNAQSRRSGSIKRVNLDGTNIETIVSRIFAPEGIALIFSAAHLSGTRIYWSSFSEGLHRSSLNGSNVETLLSEDSGIGDIVIDMTASKIYWADFGGARIQRSSLNGSNVETLVTGVRPSSIALDTAAGKMYWGEGHGKIMRADLDGTNIETIITNPDYAAETNANANYGVKGIALDVEGGKIYWAESGLAGDDGKIKCANLNGSDIKILFSGLWSVSGIALDVGSGSMYWITSDGFNNEIKRANLNGTDIETIVVLSDGFMTGIALDVTGGKIYWANDLLSDNPQRSGDIKRVNLDGTNIETIVSGIDVPYSIALSLPGADVSGPVPQSTLSNTANMDRINISEIMVASDEDRAPQWIELHNSSDTHAVNLKGWTLKIQNRRSTNFKGPINATLTFKERTVEPQETLLIISKQGRNSNNFRDEQIYNLSNQHPNLQDIVLSGEGFYLKLSNAAGKLVDEVGNFNTDDDKSIWSLPRSLTEDEARASMIRTHVDGVPRLGTDESGWISAINTKLLTGTTSYYGHPDDIGAPGVKSGGALPVSLSRFRAELTDAGIIIKWATESELDNAGFNILRSETKNGEFKIVNPKLIQGAGTTSERNTYTWTDATAKPNIVYYYQIEDISHAGVHKQLATVRMRGYVSAVGKLTTKWGDLKLQE